MPAALSPLVLPPDVVIVPVRDLERQLRDQIEHGAGDYSVTRPRSRTTSSIVDADTAALLEAFRTPTTIVDAILAVSAARGLDSRTTLEEAFDVLRGFVNEGVLVAPDSQLAQPIETSLVPGDRVGEVEVIEPAQVIVDTEVHLGRAPGGAAVAVKIARPGSEARVRTLFAREAAVLRHLDGRVSPRLLDHAEHDGRPVLVMSWCTAVDAFHAAAQARGLAASDGHDALLELGGRVIAAYAELHAAGVLHGDVHPRNVLVDADGAVTIIDYGFAAQAAHAGVLGGGGRAGVDFFMEPEVARARVAGEPLPVASPRGEQYAIAALVFLLLTGAHTHAFSLEEQEMLHELAERPPLSFAAVGAPDLPAVAAVLTRALAKEPGARFGSVAQLRDAFHAAAARDRRPPGAPPRGGPAAALLESVLARLAIPGELANDGLEAPTASVMNGAAGFAYALLRIAGIREDAALLGIADLWSARAVRAIGTHDGFWNEELEIVPETFGERSLFHTAVGVHCVDALVARGRDDEWAQRTALKAFVTAAGEPCTHIDVAFGRAGLLLGCALLAEGEDDAPLRRLGDNLRDSLWDELAAQPPVAESVELQSLGAAHGWAGVLYAVLRWADVSGAAPPPGIDERLSQLAALGRPQRRGLSWPHSTSGVVETGLEASWCNGAAGFVHLWVLAHRTTADEDHARLAHLAAWTAYDGPTAPGDLCCGLAGRAYALLCLAQHDSDARWRARARELADRAAVSVQSAALRRDSLYKGEVGAALLAAELAAPEDARMPLFAGEPY